MIAAKHSHKPLPSKLYGMQYYAVTAEASEMCVLLLVDLQDN